MWRWRSSRTVAFSSAWSIFVFACVVPVATLVLPVMDPPGTASAWHSLDPRQWRLLWNTSLLGMATAVLASLIGVPLGFALARVSVPARNAIRLALVAPALVPPYVAALAWIALSRTDGWLATLTGSELLTGWTYTMPAAVGVMALVYYPVAMLATEVAVRQIDGRLEEAALLVTRPAQVVRRITLPLAAPALTAGALLIFVLAISEFGVPGLLRVPVYTTEVFTAFAALFDVRRANVLALPLIGLCITVALVATAIAHRRHLTTRRAAIRPVLFDHWRGPAIAGVLVVLVFALVVPIAILSLEASSSRSFAVALSGSGEAIAISLLWAALGATATVGIGALIGYSVARVSKRIGRLADALWVSVFAVPSTIIGIGLIVFWNRSGPLGTVYGTDAMFLLADLARFLPVAALLMAAAARGVPVSHEEAAAMSGASWFQTGRRIVWPQLRTAAAAVWMVVFILAFGELGTSILVAPPGESTLPIRVYTIIANTPSSHVAALALLQIAVVLVPLAAIGVWSSKRAIQ